MTIVVPMFPPPTAVHFNHVSILPTGDGQSSPLFAASQRGGDVTQESALTCRLIFRDHRFAILSTPRDSDAQIGHDDGDDGVDIVQKRVRKILDRRNAEGLALVRAARRPWDQGRREGTAVLEHSGEHPGVQSSLLEGVFEHTPGKDDADILVGRKDIGENAGDRDGKDIASRGPDLSHDHAEYDLQEAALVQYPAEHQRAENQRVGPRQRLQAAPAEQSTKIGRASCRERV